MKRNLNKTVNNYSGLMLSCKNSKSNSNARFEFSSLLVLINFHTQKKNDNARNEKNLVKIPDNLTANGNKCFE